MKLSTVNWLSKAFATRSCREIALPLFITILQITPASAEQMGRSRSRLVEDLPAVTDLNLMVPVTASPLPSQVAEPASSLEPIWSNPNRNYPSTPTRERANKPKSAPKLKNSVTTNTELTSITTTRDSRKLKSNSRLKIATGSRLPLSGNYLRLVRDPSKGVNNLRNPIHTLELYLDGQKYQSFNAISGTATTQTADRNRGDNFAPLPDGTYTVSNQIVPGTIPEVGRTFIGIYPSFQTGRTDLGIHIDPSYNKTNGSDGTAGCIGMTTAADRDALNEFVAKYRPRNLFVSILATPVQQ
jgi:hypothetical protein